jgi:hypothetical protein
MKTVRRGLRLAVLLLITGSVFSLHAENEPNNTPETATTLSSNGTNSGTLGYGTDSQDWWKVTITVDGALTIATYSDAALEIDNYIYDQDKKTLIASFKNSGVHREDTAQVMNLLAGTYYIKSLGYSGQGAYTISAAFIATQYAVDAEPNDSAGAALPIAVNGSGTGHLGFYGNGSTDRVDWRKVILPADGKLVIATYADPTLEIDNSIYDMDKVSVLASYKNSGAHREDTSEVMNLVAGTYYIRTLDYEGYGSYTITTLFTPASLANDAEPNDSAGAAVAFSVNTSSTGHLGFDRAGYDDGVDWRKVTTTVDGRFVVATLSDPTMEIDNYIYDQDKTTLLASYKNSGAHREDTSEVVNLGPGTYYVRTLRYAGYGSYSITNLLMPAQLGNDAEPNGSTAQAVTLALNNRVTGHLGFYQAGVTDENDYYALTMSAAIDTLFVRTDSNPALEIDLGLYTSANQQVGSGSTYGVTELMAAPKLSAGTYYIRVRRWSGYGSYNLIASGSRPAGSTVGVEKMPPYIPIDATLGQNYPNPFNPSTTIAYGIPFGTFGAASLRVYDLLGREVAVLVNEVKQAGMHSVTWNAGALPSGVYVCRLRIGNFSAVKKLLLQK